jgi:hypothetical protein
MPRKFCEPLTQREPSRALPAVKAVNPQTSADPLRDSDAETWARWSKDRELRDVVAQRKLDLDNRQLSEKPIYPRELAERLADEIRYTAQDWRACRPTLGPAWGQLLKQQPELSPLLVKRRESIIVALFGATPPEFHPAISDLRRLFDLTLAAHECAAFQIGVESGRLAESTPIGRRPKRKRASVSQNGSLPVSSLRLTIGDEKGGA